MIACAFLLPLPKLITPWLIAIWTLFAILFYPWKKLLSAFVKNKTAWIFPIYYLLSVISLLYTNNVSNGFFKLEVGLSYIIFPLIMLPAVDFNIQKRFKVMLAFVAGNLVAVIICIIHAALHYHELGLSTFFYYNLSLFHHTTYAAMYLTFALSILYICYLRNRVFPIAKWTFFPIFFLFLIFVYFLSSKSGLISIVLLIIVFLGLSLKQSFSWANAVFSLIIIGVTVFIVLQNDRFTGTSERVSSEISPTTTESTTARILVWETSLKVIKENIFIGTAPGDARDVLVSEYHKQGYTGAEKKRLNTHNQFMQTILALGIPGILLLFSAFLLPLLLHGRTNIILIFFLGITGFNFLFESALETQSGIIFFMFFFTLLNYSNKYNDNDSVLTTSN